MTENNQERSALPDLADRQREILRAVIREFISTAQPVAKARPWNMIKVPTVRRTTSLPRSSFDCAITAVAIVSPHLVEFMGVFLIRQGWHVLQHLRNAPLFETQ